MPPVRTISLRAEDGVSLVADFWPGNNGALPGSNPAPRVTGRIGCVVAHGFTGSARNADVVRICRGLTAAGRGESAGQLDVLALDFRGHGRSGGVGTAGVAEIQDVAAGVAWLRLQGYAFVAILGWSMGGTVVLRHAGLGGDADAVVSVSAAGTWFERGTRPMRVAHWMIETRSGRAATRLLRRTRVSTEGWYPVTPESPAEVIGAISPRPLLLIHGSADHYFPMHHVESLAAAAPSAEVWIESDMAHAENATTAALIDRIGRWVLAAGDPQGQVCDDVRRD